MHFELPSHIPNLAYLAKYNGKVDLTTSSILGCLSDAYELRKSLSLWCFALDTKNNGERDYLWYKMMDWSLKV